MQAFTLTFFIKISKELEKLDFLVKKETKDTLFGLTE